MASKYGYTVDVLIYDMTLQDINKLDAAQMRDALHVLNDAANKRARRLEAAGETGAYAYQAGLKGKDVDTLRFTTPQGANRNQLYKSLIEAQNFLRSDTSTLAQRTSTVVNKETGEIKRIVTNKGWKNVKGKIKQAMFDDKADTPEAEQVFNKTIQNGDFWAFVRNLQNNYGFESSSAINVATFYNSHYDTYEAIHRAKSYLTGAEVDPQEIVNTSVVELWEDIFVMSGGQKVDYSTREGYASKEEREAFDDANFTNPWRGN